MRSIETLKNNFVFIPACLCLVTFLLFGPSLSFEFVYDDQWTIVKNPSIQSLQPVSRFFLDKNTFALPSTGMNDTAYRPLPTLWFAWDYKMWGLNPLPYKLSNLTLHAMNGILLFFILLSRMRLTRSAAFFGALLFLVHPAQVESVVWVTQRSNLLCLLGMLLAFWVLTDRAQDKSSLKTFIIKMALPGFLFSGLALLSKETGVTFLALFVLWDILFSTRQPIPGARPSRKLIVYGFVFMSVLLWLFLRYEVLGHLPQRAPREGSYVINALTGLASGWEYFKLLFFPLDLRVSHWEYFDNPLKSALVWKGLALLIASTALMALGWKKHRRAVFFTGWIILTLLPVLNLIPIDTFVAERFLYVPLAGLAGLSACFWEKTENTLRKYNVGHTPKKRFLFFLIFPFTLGIVTFKHIQVWQKDLTLWKSAVQSEPDNPFARACLAEAYMGTDRLEEAKTEYKIALTKKPTVSIAFAAMNNLAELLNKLNQPQEALQWSEKALTLRPHARTALYNKIVSLSMLNQKNAAEKTLTKAEKTYPTDPGWPLLRKKIIHFPQPECSLDKL